MCQASPPGFLRILRCPAVHISLPFAPAYSIQNPFEATGRIPTFRVKMFV
jgi:hypothetical protein